MSQKDTTRVVRISIENYENLNRLKKQLARKQGKTKLTYDGLIAEALTIAELLVSGQEVYSWDNQVFDDVSEAWSHAVEHSLLNKVPIEQPKVLLVLGKDDTFEVPK